MPIIKCKVQLDTENVISVNRDIRQNLLAITYADGREIVVPFDEQFCELLTMAMECHRLNRETRDRIQANEEAIAALKKTHEEEMRKQAALVKTKADRKSEFGGFLTKLTLMLKLGSWTIPSWIDSTRQSRICKSRLLSSNRIETIGRRKRRIRSRFEASNRQSIN